MCGVRARRGGNKKKHSQTLARRGASCFFVMCVRCGLLRFITLYAVSQNMASYPQFTIDLYSQKAYNIYVPR